MKQARRCGMKREVGVGIIGVGRMGELHIQSYLANPLARVVGICDTNEERTREMAERYGVPACPRTQDLLARDDLEAVSICTNDESHVSPTLEAIAAGKHILLEKPIATSLADADRIIAAADAAPIRFMIGQIVRFDPRYERVKALADKGELGELLSLFVRRHNTVKAQDTLRGRVSVLSFLGVHDFDYLLWLAGSPAVRVFTESVSKLLASRGYPVEDNTFTTIRFANGTIGCAEIGWALPANEPRRADFKVEVIGTRGVARIDLVEQALTVCTESGGYVRPDFGHSLGAELEHFLACVRDGKPCQVTGRDGRAALELSIAAQRAAKTGAPVTLPL
jgi:predicted dehydrogenase